MAEMTDEHYGVIAYLIKNMLSDEEPMSNCCDFPFYPPGYPDNDICSNCGEHADIMEDDNNDSTN